MTRRNQPVVGDSTVEPESGKLCHEFRYDPTGSEPLSTTLVRAIAEAREIAPEEMDRHRSPSGVSLLSFRTYGLEVVIREGQQVTIYEVED